ncbi:MAG: sulfatase-like hydrolase/transferase [Anaerolineaceae bacterium]|nr:sulfatase-like hydrolase/transferase [Anaerolineaceae bacterium]
MADSRSSSEEKQSGSPPSTVRTWLLCVAVAEAILVVIYCICTVRLLIKNSSSAPTVSEQVVDQFLPTLVGSSAWILAGYLIIGLFLGSFCWLMLWSWSSVFRRRVTVPLAGRGTILIVLAILFYKTVSSAVYSPRILENVCRTDFGIWLIGWTGDVVPPWLLTAVRALFLSAICVLVVGGVIRSFSRMERRVRQTVVALAAVLPILVGGLGLVRVLEQLPAEPRDDGRPNILILASDGLRPDHLGLYGYDKPTSVNIDRLGATAVRFENYYVPQARTLPSWTSMMTGTYPHTHGLRYTWPRDSQIKLGLPTLAGELKKKGYKSYVLSDWAGGDFGKVDYGFDVTEVGPEAWSINTWISQETCRGHPLLVAFADNPIGHKMYPTIKGPLVNPNPGALTRTAVRHLEESAHRRQPFFMIVFYSETHLPFSTRYPYYRMFARDGYTGHHKLSVNIPSYEAIASGGLEAENYFDPQQARALYDGAIRCFDDQVGEILGSLKELNLWNDTTVIITSDHGEDLFETEYSWGHGRFLFGDDYDSRIPLIISDPQLRDKERSIKELAGTVDFMPTVLQRVGQAVPEECEGKSLLDLIRGQREERPGMIFAESGVLLGGEKQLEGDDYLRYPPLSQTLEVTELDNGQVGIKRQYLDVMVTARQRMVRTPQWKLLYLPLTDGARYELYDLERDPECSKDVKEAHPEVFERLKSRLWEWMEQDPLRERRGEHMVRKRSPSSAIE